MKERETIENSSQECKTRKTRMSEAVDSADLIPRSFRSSMNAFDANWGPLSEMILSGNPNCL